ncbi:hypothetical protein ACES2L_08545 [Bdellovibrio bacteriovorus]
MRQEFVKYQKLEKFLTGTMVLLSVFTPVMVSIMLNKGFHWAYSVALAGTFMFFALWTHVIRSRVSKKLLSKYEQLQVGSVLSKKLTPTQPRQFVITETDYNHFYLKCLKTGEKVLLSKRRVREDFDIAN